MNINKQHIIIYLW